MGHGSSSKWDGFRSALFKGVTLDIVNENVGGVCSGATATKLQPPNSDYRFYQTAPVSTVPGTDKSMRVTALNPPFTCKPPNAQVPLGKGRKQAMQILNGRAGLGPMSEAKAHALLLRAAHSLCAPSAWLA